MDTPAISQAIAAAARDGGGAVRFPAGTYLCYSIHLASQVSLQFMPGATILAAPCRALGGPGDYDAAEPNPAAANYEDFGHRHWHNALLWGEGLHDVSIVGPGLLHGRGLTRGRGETEPGMGDKTLALKNCRNVTLRDFAILQGGHFGVLATGVDNLTIDNLTIDTNRDGIDIDCCHNVRVSNCTVNSPWDDGICPKSSYALGYSRPTDDVTISNCLVSGSYQLGSVLDGSFRAFPAGQRVPRTGRIKCGTESNGGFQNITIANCIFEGCQGLALETVDGALLENVVVTNVTMRNITSAPLFFRLGARLRGPAGTAVGRLRRVQISNLVVDGSATRLCSILSGIPGHAIEDVQLRGIHVNADGGGTAAMAALQPAEQENHYPEPGEFGPMPAYGFFVRHARGLDVSEVELRTTAPDQRPAFVLQDVENAEFFRVRPARVAGVPAFVLRDVRDFSVHRSRGVPDRDVAALSEGAL